MVEKYKTDDFGRAKKIFSYVFCGGRKTAMEATMIVEKFWATPLVNGIFGGLKPTEDPFDDTVFYIGDGWGSTYPSMKFRKSYIENGDETARCAVKNVVRCCYIT
jgi:hypothetical protein